MKAIFRTAIIALVALMAVGCKSHQEIVNPGNTVDVDVAFTPDLQAIASNQGNWTMLKCGGDIELGGSMSFSAGMQMKMERGKYIYISIRPLLGIEAAKLIVDGNTVMMVDKLHKRYIREDVSLLTGGVPVTIETLQDIFLGRAHVLGSGTLSKSNLDMVSAETGVGQGVIVPKEQYKGFVYSYTVDPGNQITSADVKPAKSGGVVESNYSVQYSKVKAEKPGNIAHKATIATQIKGKKLKLTLDYDNMKWNQKDDVDLSEPNGYKKIEAAELFNMFK